MSNTVIEYVGISADHLTPDQKAKIDAIISSQPAGDLLSVRVYKNIDATSEEDLPSGLQLIFKPSAKVDPTLIGEGLFQVFAVSTVNSDKQLTDDYFMSKSSAVHKSVQQFPAEAVRADMRSIKNNVETKAWAPELGGPGAFAGVYSKARDGDFRQKDYFIAARSTVPLLVKDLKERLSAPPREAGGEVTYNDLLNKEEWRKLMRYNQEAANRNVKRAISNVAEACQVSIAREDDLASHLADPNHAHPEMAIPDWSQTTHSIQAGVYKNTPVAVVSYGIVPAEECLLMKDQLFFVVANPYDGVAAFKLTDHNKVQAAIGLPADAGRRLAYEKVPRNEQAYKGRMTGVGWQINKTKEVSSSINPELHPEAHNTIDAKFKQSMQHLGWNSEDHVERLVPLPLKLYNNELKR